MKTTIETESASVVLLSREAYDALNVARMAASIRSTELVKMRDKFSAYIIKATDEEKARGYTKYFTASEIIDAFRDIFEIVENKPKQPETGETEGE